MRQKKAASTVPMEMQVDTSPNKVMVCNMGNTINDGGVCTSD
jgi:hypothetical protein